VKASIIIGSDNQSNGYYFLSMGKLY